jgi:hypothetical protein
MTSGDRLARVEWLTALGVPAAYHDAIIDAPGSAKNYVVSTVLGIGAVAVVIGVTIGAFFWLDSYVHAQAMALARQTGATLINVNVGIGPLLLMFGLIAVTGWAGLALSARRKGEAFLGSAASGINRPPPPSFVRTCIRWIFGVSVRRAARRATTAEGFLRAMVNDMTRIWRTIAIVALVPGVVLTVIETDHFWVAGPSGVIEHRLLPPFTSRSYELASATALETGCNHTDKTESLHYDVQFASGDWFGLGGAVAVAGRSAAALEQIDAKLNRAIPHQRWSHLDRDPVHPACLRYWGAQFGQFGQQRLAKLLRMTPEEQRRAF